MRIGSFRHRLTLERQTSDTSGFEETGPWVAYATVWGRKDESSRGREVLASQQTQGEMSHVFELRYRADVLVTDRVVYNSRNFDIQAVENPDGRRRKLVLRCKEHRADGE